MSKPIFPTKYFNLLIWTLAIVIRYYGATTPGQHYDMGTFHAWGNHLMSVGSRQFFSSIWSDYLPLPILTFGPVAWLANFKGISFDYLFKLIYSAIELILIYAIGRSLPKLPRWPLWLLLLSPAGFGDISFWGQVDPIPALMALLSFTTLSPVLFGLAVAFKPIMILLAPLIWFLAVRKGSKWWQFPLLSALTFFATAIPFVDRPVDAISHLFTRVLSQAGTYPFTTVNAWNLWSLVPNNVWLQDNTTVLSLSAHFLGLSLFAIMSFLTLRNWAKTGWNHVYSYRVAGTILVLFYALTTRMHERHLFFGLPFLTLAAYFEPWILFPLTLLTASFTLNLWGAFYWVNHAQTWPVSPGFISSVSWLVTLTALGLSLIWSWPKLLSSLLSHLKTHKILVFILVIATLLRFTNLAHPPVYIFDEVYHAFTAKEYLHNHIDAWEWWTTPPTGVAYEWTHPPVAKYAMVVGMLLFGENSFGWRVGSAVAGVLSILGLYRLSRSLRLSRSIALSAAFLVAIEGLHISQSRIAMNDIYMLAFLVWSLYLAVKSRWKWAAILFGLSLASKWSALYGLVPLALIYLHTYPLNFSLSAILRSALAVIRLLLIVTCVYVLTFAPFILAPHTWEQFIELHRQMWYYHTHLVATHGYQSTPLQWIFSLRPVWYYVNYGSWVSNIYAQANPMILWLGLVAFIVQLKQLRSFPFLLIASCYLIFTLPWVFSPRIMFFYHYLPSSTFLCIILAAWLADLSPRARVVTLVCCFVSLLLISPMLYGFPMPPLYWNTLFTLVPSWK